MSARAATSSGRHLSTGVESARALFVGLVGTAGSSAHAGPTADVLATPIHAAVVHLAPAPVVVASIQALGTASEVLAFVVALLPSVCALGVAAFAAGRIGRRFDDPAVSVLATDVSRTALAERPTPGGRRWVPEAVTGASRK